MEWFERRFASGGDGDGAPPPPGPWTGCTFESCQFEDLAFGEMDWRNARFERCTFLRCDLRGVRWTGARFHGVQFDTCVLDKLRWNTLTTLFLSITLTDCQAMFGDWSEMELKNSALRNCNLTGSDFSGADARQVDWSGSRLTEVIFHRTDLREGDFRTATDWTIDPAENKVRDTHFSRQALEGLVTRLGLQLD